MKFKLNQDETGVPTAGGPRAGSRSVTLARSPIPSKLLLIIHHRIVVYSQSSLAPGQAHLVECTKTRLTQVTVLKCSGLAHTTLKILRQPAVRE